MRHTSWLVARRPAHLGKGTLVVLLVGLMVFVIKNAPAQATPTMKIGIVTFLSGGAAGPFGIPARNAAELMVEAINKGTVPAPYNTKGLAGAQIEPIIIDEAGSATKQVTEYRNLVQRQHVDVVVGYISSGHCLAIAPAAEELQKLTIFFDCGTPRIFEEASYKYVFRTGAHATMDNVAAARYLLDKHPEVKSIAGINQNYAWGQDSWADFKASMQALKPSIKTATEQFPKLYAGQYGAEISALLTSGADVIHSSFWNGDLEAFIFQARPRGIFKKSLVILTAGETAMPRLGKQLPDGVIIGARGPHGDYAPDSALNRWFRAEYARRYNIPPTYPSYKMAMALLGLKTAVEKAARATSGTMPSQQQIIAALEGLTFTSPSGTVRMVLGKGHQAIQDTAYGVSKFDRESGRLTMVDVKYYPAECVNPPAGMKSLDWIKSGFKGAKCD